MVEVGKVIMFSPPNQKVTSGEPMITESMVLEELKQLAWKDPAAFLSLEAICLSNWPIEVSPKVKEKLRKLDLTDELGHPLPITYFTIRDIAKDAEDAKLLAK